MVIQSNNLRHILILVLLLNLGSAHAALPTTMSYQGHVTDSVGTPINGPANVTFRLYSVDTGGTALWTETQSVNLDLGVFSVELGSVTPFTAGLFNQPLWIGLEVGTDGEMSPRSPLTATGYAFKSEDANTVNGLQSNEIIDAASDEVRTPISALPFTISQSGSYYITGNLDGSAGGIDITADNVTLDLMGFTIDGGGTVADYGIDFSGRSNITIRNGTVTGFGWAGIAQFLSSRYAKTMDINVLGNGTLGSTNTFSGIYLGGSNHHIERCVAGENGGYGIFAGSNSKLINNTAYANSGAYGIYGSTSSVLKDNLAYSNTGTFAIYGGGGSVLSGNMAYSNTVTYAIFDVGGSVLSGNTAYSNTVTYAIYDGGGSVLSGNTAYQNTGSGLYGGINSILSDNTAYNNTGSYGIVGLSGAKLIGNTAYYNQHWGIYTSGSNLIKDNTITANNVTATANEGGLRVYGDSQVVGNTLDNNSQNNIYVYWDDNTIENNLVTDSINGIFFNSTGNFYGNNRASGNTTNYNLNGTTQTTNVYSPNISF